MSAPLAIVGCGAVTPVGLNALQTCAAIRARISGVREIAVVAPEFAPVSGADIPARAALKEPLDQWLVNLAARSILEALAPENPEAAQTALLLLVRQNAPAQLDGGASSAPPWIKRIEARLNRRFHAASATFDEGHAAVVGALAKARELLGRREVKYCLIVGVDSMTNQGEIERLAGWNRLYGEGNSQGVIPAEGSAAVLVTLPGQQRHTPFAHVIGLGSDTEPDTVLGTRTSVGRGLVSAMRKAQEDAGIAESLISQRLSDMNGERYRGLESMFAEGRFYRTRRENGLGTILPAMSVADMGSAAGPLLIVVAAIAFAKGYAKGKCAMCEMSSEKVLRGACVMVGPLESLERAAPNGAEKEMSFPALERSRQAAVIPNVIQQHAEEAAFLWVLHRVAVKRPDFYVRDLLSIEVRMEAHFDGLRVAGDIGWEILKKQLGWKEPGEFFAAAKLAVESASKPQIDFIFGKLVEAPEGTIGMASALGWLPPEQTRSQILGLLSADNPDLRLVGISAAAIHRFYPGAAFGKALLDPNLRLRARALKAAGELGRTETTVVLRQNLKLEDLACRFWAAWSLALLSNDALAISTLRSIAESANKFSERAAAMYARRGDPQAVKEWYRKQPAKPPKARLAIAAAGALGEIEAIPWLLGLMNQKPLARAAGEAFSLITGADLALLDLEVKPPADFHAGPTEDPKDEDVSIDPDDHLPWPNPEKLAKWWEKNQNQFTPGTRYLLGKPMEIANLNEVLRIGKQRQRAAAAVELAIRQPGTPLFETRMPGFRQRQLLGV